MNITTILLVVAAVYCIFRLISMQKDARINKKILRILGAFGDKQAFEEALNQEFSPENTPEYTARLQALRVWGGAYHDDEDMFHEGLANMDVSVLLTGDPQRSAVGLNESTFFWLLLFAPNNLYSSAKSTKRWNRTGTSLNMRWYGSWPWPTRHTTKRAVTSAGLSMSGSWKGTTPTCTIPRT